MEPATAAGVGGPGPGPGYPESTESSPRSRGGDSWDEPFPSSAAAAAAAAAGGRLRLMCSFGGRIVPRPTDKTLCYLGGETRIVAVDRHASLADLHARLSRSLLGGLPFTLKYQLPNEDLDSLISVSTDEDLDNLIDEYDRIAAAAPTPATGSSRTSRIRLFLFPAKPESSSSLGSLLDDSSKSENWFVDALNSAISGSLDGIPRGISTDSASVNCLLGLEDDSSVHSRSGVPNSAPTEDQRANQQKLPAATAASAASAAGGRHPHDVQSVPDSPMMDKNSSFGSTSSAPSLSNLPPIRVRQEDRPPGPPAAVEDHFAQMGISDQQVPPAAVAYMQPPPQMPVPAMAAVPVAATMSPSEASGRLFSDDDNKSDHGGVARKPLPPKQEAPPVADPSNRGVYYNDRSPPGSEVRRDMPVGTDASSYRIPVSAPEAVVAAAAATVASQPPAGYIYAQMHAPPPQQQQPPPPQQQPPPPQPQQQQQQQPAPQQFVTAGNQHFIHNPATGTFIPIQTYYNHPVPQQAPPQPVLQPQQQPAFDPNTGMYYIPMRQNAPHQQYSMPPGAQVTLPPPTLVDTAPKPTVPIPQVAVNSADLQQPVYRTTAAAAPAPAPNAAPGYYHHVIQSQHHHPVQQPVGNMQGNFGYEYADPSRGQVYYSQAAAPPTLPPQYHQPMVAPDAGQADIKQNRAS